MAKRTNSKQILARGKSISIGVDVHKRSWHVSAICEGCVLLRSSMPPSYEGLKKILKRFPECDVTVAYEAGPSGFGLYDHLSNDHVRCLVVPPSRIPVESGNRVKTDPRDSLKLASLLEAGLLKGAVVPSKERRMHRELLRTRHQIVRQRVKIMTQIKSKLLFHSLTPGKGAVASWSKRYVKAILELDFPDLALRKAIEALLELYDQLGVSIRAFNRQIYALSKTEQYRDKVQLLKTIPGIGHLTAMVILTELGDLGRFRSNDQLASFLGLTPSEFSSGEFTRKGRITRCGNKRVRTCLVESSWELIRRDEAMRKKYESIKLGRGGKKAIVAVARNLSGRIRGMMLREECYVTGVPPRNSVGVRIQRI